MQQFSRGLLARAPSSRILSTVSRCIGASPSPKSIHLAAECSTTPFPGMPDDFENYKSGAWLYNDKIQRNNRFVKFDVAALIAVAVQTAGASSCTSFKFLADGTSNRLFDIRLDNGIELVAKLPFVIAGPVHLMTASEVATMMFAREILELPVPRVYTWCSRAEETKVGWEYIIMQKVHGVQLMDRWWGIKGPAVMGVLKDLVAAEQKMTDTEFGMLGSLFLAKDLPEDTGSPVLRFSTADKTMPRQYKIGPSVDRRFWRGARSEMKIDRGPWASFPAYARAIADCEIAWLETHARPHLPTSPLYRSPLENDPKTHVALLQAYISVIDYLVPPRRVRALTLWHPDLHASNLIVTSPPAEAPRIESIIDWQTARIEPLLHAGTIPTFLDYSHGTYVTPVAPGRVDARPELPSNFDTLKDEEKSLANRQLTQAARNELYTIVTEEQNPSLHKYRTFEHTELYSWPHYWASRTWDEGTAILEKVLMEVCDEWEHIAGSDIPCPISFSDERRANHAEDMRRFVQEREIEELIDEIGVQPDGWVPVDKLDDAMRRNREVCETYISGLEQRDKERVRHCWPFQDGALSLTAEACR
ncbi:kinase-like domain-containing protein [Mycena epipterygia]|nr:kinase-like domain-containing protein [Mycena epipterygia]